MDESTIDKLAREALEAIPENNYRARDEVIRLKRLLGASDLSIREQMEALSYLKNIHYSYVGDFEKDLSRVVDHGGKPPKTNPKYTGKVYEDGSGWTYWELDDGRLVDNDDLDAVDIEWDSLDEFKKHNDDIPIWQKGDELGKKRAWDADLAGGQKDIDEIMDAMSGLNPSEYEKAMHRQKMQAAALKAKKKKIKDIGLKVLKGGKTGLKMIGAIPTPVTATLGALGWAMDAKDAYALTESTLNPETEEEMARQKMLAEIFRRNEIP